MVARAELKRMDRFKHFPRREPPKNVYPIKNKPNKSAEDEDLNNKFFEDLDF